MGRITKTHYAVVIVTGNGVRRRRKMHIKSNQIKSNLFAINSVHNITMSSNCVWLDRQAITSHLCLPMSILMDVENRS